jgi:hypothetical protein
MYISISFVFTSRYTFFYTLPAVTRPKICINFSHMPGVTLLILALRVFLYHVYTYIRVTCVSLSRIYLHTCYVCFSIMFKIILALHVYLHSPLYFHECLFYDSTCIHIVRVTILLLLSLSLFLHLCLSLIPHFAMFWVRQDIYLGKEGWPPCFAI